MFAEYLLLWLLFFLPLVFPPIFIDPYDLPKILFFYFCSFLLIILTSFSIFSKKNLVLPRKSFLKLLLVFIFIYTISTVFSIHKLTSLTGIWEMYGTYTGGLIHLLTLILLFLLIFQLNLKKDFIKKIITYLTVSGTLVSFYGIYQYLQSFLQQDLNYRIRSTIGQPNRLAFFLITVLPLSISGFIAEKKTLYKVFCFIGFLSIFIALILTFSRAAWITIFMLFLIIFFSNIKNLKTFIKENKNYLFVLLFYCFIVLLFGGRPLTLRITNIINDLKTQTGSTYFRLLEFQTGLNVFKSQSFMHKLIGTGPETIKFTYPQFRPIKLNQFPSEKNIQVYTLNSQYLQYLNTIGILGLISFISIIYFVINIYLKIKEKNIYQAGIFYSFLGISLSNIFYSQTIITHCYFWIFAAIILSSKIQKLVTKEKFSIIKSVLILIILFALLGLTSLFFISSSLFHARQNNFKKATIILPFFDFLWREYSLQLHKEALDKKDIKIMEKAISTAEKAYTLNPLESTNIASLYSALYSASGYLKMDKAYQEKALSLAQEWTKLNPSEPQPFDALGLSLLDLRQISKALENFEKAINLDKEFLPSYLHAGEALKQMGKVKEAITYYQKVLEKRPNWLNAQQELKKAQELLDKHN